MLPQMHISNPKKIGGPCRTSRDRQPVQERIAIGMPSMTFQKSFQYDSLTIS